MLFRVMSPWKYESVAADMGNKSMKGYGRHIGDYTHPFAIRKSLKILKPTSFDSGAGENATAMSSLALFILVCNKKLLHVSTGTRPSIRSRSEGKRVFQSAESCSRDLPPIWRATTGVSCGIVESRGMLICGMT